MTVTAANVLNTATPVTKTKYSDRQFIAIYGVCANVGAVAWNHIIQLEAYDVSVGLKDFLMLLHFLKTYSSETVLCRLFGITEKTFRSKYKKALSLLARIPIICWENRRLIENMDHRAKVSIDGTDCLIFEPTPFDTKWFSHKHNGPGLRYEIGICIVSEHIVWVSGPHKCGVPDLVIAREGILYILEDGEKIIADGGYRGEPNIWHKGHCRRTAKLEGVVRARHENANGRLKNFGVLNQRFRHDLSLHGYCFHACANLVQLTLLHESPLFQFEYSD